MKRYPSPFSAGDKFTFENKHGNVTLEAVTAPRPIAGRYIKDAPPECLISWDTMEQIALITDQVRLQPFIGDSLEAPCAFVRHSSPSEVGWVKVITLEYTTKAPAHEQIEEDMNAGRNRLFV